jgi:hypothetical protein
VRSEKGEGRREKREGRSEKLKEGVVRGMVGR